MISGTQDDDLSSVHVETEARWIQGSPRPGRFSKERFRLKLWKALRVFRRDDTRFAIKVGAGAALYVRVPLELLSRPFDN